MKEFTTADHNVLVDIVIDGLQDDQLVLVDGTVELDVHLHHRVAFPHTGELGGVGDSAEHKGHIVIIGIDGAALHLSEGLALVELHDGVAAEILQGDGLIFTNLVGVILGVLEVLEHIHQSTHHVIAGSCGDSLGTWR